VLEVSATKAAKPSTPALARSVDLLRQWSDGAAALPKGKRALLIRAGERKRLTFSHACLALQAQG